MNKPVLAFDMGGTMIKYGLFDASGALCQVAEFPTDARDGAEKVFAKMAEVARAEFSKQPISGIAISSTAVPDPDTGVIIAANQLMPGAVGFRVKEFFANELDTRAEILEDIMCFALAEHTYGAAKGADSAAFLTIGTGLGCCLLSGRTLKPMLLAELRTGGNRLEDLCSTRALIYDIAKNRNEPSSAWDGKRAIAEALRKDPCCEQAFDRFCDVLAAVVSMVYAVALPKVIVLGGGIMCGFDYIRPRLMGSLGKYGCANAPVVPTSLGWYAPLYGVYKHFRNQERSDAQESLMLLMFQNETIYERTI